MAHKFKCGNCGKEIAVKWLGPGEQAKCRGCGAAMTVPANAESVSDDAVPGPSREAASAVPPSEARPCCPTCRYLQLSPSYFDNGIGYCRRFPPHPRERYAEVTASDWCGEHAPA